MLTSDKEYTKTNGRPIGIKTHVKKMRLAAENDDLEGMLSNLRLAAIKAFEASDDPFNRMTPRFILEILNAELQLARMRLKFQKEGDGDNKEELNEFLERMREVEDES